MTPSLRASFPSLTDRLNNPYGLTEREQEVVSTMAARQSDMEACKQLKISYGTFLSFRRNLMHKFGARNELHLAHLISTLVCPDPDSNLIALEDIPSAWGY